MVLYLTEVVVFHLSRCLSLLVSLHLLLVLQSEAELFLGGSAHGDMLLWDGLVLCGRGIRVYRPRLGWGRWGRWGYRG